MSEAIKLKRGKEILRLLKEHGPLSAKSLTLFMEPPQSRDCLYRSIENLERFGFIQRLKGQNPASYFALNQSEGIRTSLARILNCPEDEILQGRVKRVHLYHNEMVERWQFVLRKAFPEAIFVREWGILRHDRAKEMLIALDGEHDLLPDLMMILPKRGPSVELSIALEFERSLKSQFRLTRKLKKYVNGTALDGLIYVAETHQISDAIRNIYRLFLSGKRSRVSHYPENFFLFSDATESLEMIRNRLFNAQAQRVDLNSWIEQLRETPRLKRRDSFFITPRPAGVMATVL